MPSDRADRLPDFETAQLRWRDDGTPESLRFGDIYFAPPNGLAESRHVFLDGCDLPTAWHGRSRFTIGETGFGSGLNFLAVWALWRRVGPAGARLNYVSVEQYPWTLDDLRRAAPLWGDVAALGATLAAHYPGSHPRPGVHTLVFDDGRISLTLLIGEALAMLDGLDAAVDAWFLDGFAPAANPQMWRPALLTEIARLAVPGARLATFTVAGPVRRGLAEAGFTVTRRPGFGAKRQCLAAVRRSEAVGAWPPHGRVRPWARPPAVIVQPHPDVLVLGGGIAGACAAEALARRGARITLVERRARLADGASGNPVGVVSPWINLDDGPRGRFAAAAFAAATALYERLGHPGETLWRCGALHLPRSDAEADKFRHVAAAGDATPFAAAWLDETAAAAVCGVTPAAGGLFLADAMAVRPPPVVQALVGAARATVLFAPVRTLQHEGATWRVRTPDGGCLAAAPLCVVASAADALGLAPFVHFRLQILRGQITEIAAQSTSRPLRTVIAQDGYLTPAIDDRHVVGASFTPLGLGASADLSGAETPQQADDAANLARLQTLVPGLFDTAQRLAARARVRVASPDRLPVVGAAPDADDFARAYAGLAQSRAGSGFPDAPVWPGLFLLNGLGARGLTTAPVCADLLAAQITGDPWPLDHAAAETVSPGRFLIRAIRRGRPVHIGNN